MNRLRWDEIGLAGREKQVKELNAAIKGFESTHEASSVLIYGPSGSGKSVLAHQVLQQHNSVCVRGKYDQHTVSGRPFSAIVDATTDLCEKLGVVVPRNVSKFDIEEREVLFTLAACLNTDPSADDSRNENKEHQGPDDTVLIRFMNIFRRFLIGVCKDVPLVLFLDDLQWADDSSRSLLESMYNDKRMEGLLLVGAIRTGEPTSFSPPYNSRMRNLKIIVDSLTCEDVNKVVSKALGSQIEQTEELSKAIFKATSGNPYFVKQFLTSMHSERHVTFMEETNCFQWDMKAIQERADASSDVVELMVNVIESMPISVQMTLAIGSTLGHTFNFSDIAPLFGNFDLICLLPTRLSNRDNGSGCIDALDARYLDRGNLTKALGRASDRGLIALVKEGVYRFTHDRVQQAACRHLPTGEIGTKVKAKLGSLFLILFNKNMRMDLRLLYTATDLLINNASCADSPKVAITCLEAAETASRQAAFKTAARFADCGWTRVEKLMNENHYELGVKLLSLSAEMHYSCGSIPTARTRVDVIKANAKCFEDCFRGNRVLFMCMVAECDWTGACQTGISQLNEMGLNFPRRPGKFSVLTHLFSLKRRLNGRQASDMKNLPKSTNAVMKETQHIVNLVGTAAFFGGADNVCALSCIYSMLISLKHGLSSRTPIALCAYLVLLAEFGFFEEAYDFGTVATEMCQEKGSEPSLCLSYTVFHSNASYIRDGFKSSAKNLLHAADFGFKHNDAYQAFIALYSGTVFSVFAGNTLFQSERRLIESSDTFLEYKQSGHLVKLEPFRQLVLYLRKRTSSKHLKLTGIYVDQDGNDYRADDLQNRRTDLIAHEIRMILYFLLGEHEAAEKERRKFARYPPEPGVTVNMFFHCVFSALHAFARAKGRKTCPQARPYVKKVKSLCVLQGSDMISCYTLLLAEKLALKPKKIQETVNLYLKAISGFQRGEIFLMEAVAYERLALAYSRTGDTAAFAQNLRQSYRAFEIFGADLKLDQLRETYPAVGFST